MDLDYSCTVVTLFNFLNFMSWLRERIGEKKRVFIRSRKGRIGNEKIEYLLCLIIYRGGGERGYSLYNIVKILQGFSPLTLFHLMGSQLELLKQKPLAQLKMKNGKIKRKENKDKSLNPHLLISLPPTCLIHMQSRIRKGTLSIIFLFQVG